MLVPRSFRYNAAPSMRVYDEKEQESRRRKREPKIVRAENKTRPQSPVRARTEPTRAPTPPVDVPTTPERTPVMPPKKNERVESRARSSGGRKSSKHDPNALPPAVAALLAVTQIPRPKPNQFRRRSTTADRRISIDELVNEWKSEESLKSSYGSSPTLSMLLEEDDDEEHQPTPQNGTPEEGNLHTRSTSLDSVPSLSDDNRSTLSGGSLPTPGSLRSRKSYSNFKKEKQRSLPASVDCATSHPLASLPSSDDDDEGPPDFLLTPTTPTTPKPKSSFKSNLTTSFAALRNALATFSVSSVSPSQRNPNSPMSDDMLWSHPFLFPRFSPEVRPAIEGTPTQAQRRYLNPLPLTFEEQEAPYQMALHAPYLAEQSVEGKAAPTIQMQTYSRGRRKASSSSKNRSSSSNPDPQSEAGRALTGSAGVRQREPRENSDFLRVVVLEMNMRREGKLEYGRAKIWLPPMVVRESGGGREGRVPRRWVGVSVGEC
ncbi:uncharacterized protein LTR77_007376 [Saxophila tyrrhenica]|uniref:Uncharacterized protein n=1 Tax=Saxophila tyrrhenica TaxID=1690608 RepID=A0AAV9P7G5_9PEZI|nr:hypothetical protein LTR77_007376 [Saxophila tyrrhenica]